MCEAEPGAEATLVMDRTALRRARQFLDEHWCTDHAHVLRPQAELVLGELVTNAVRNGTPPVRIAVRCGGEAGATIEVSDADPNPPQVRPQDPEDLDTPGIQLVDLLSDAWGVCTRPGGKTVWSRLVG